MRRASLGVLIAVAITLVGISTYLHRNNDGLWFQADSPRHAMNGAFWRDFLASGQYFGPWQFAMDYYRNYPAIAPTIWPPLVYVVEAGAYHIAGLSATTARAVIFAFTVLLAVYFVLFARELSASSVGTVLSISVLAQPAVILWSNAVMLEIPALALGTACMYHLEKARQAIGRRHLVAAVAFAVACAHTRMPGILLPLAWGTAVLATGTGRRLLKLDALALYAAGGLLLVPWLLVTAKFSGILIQQATHLGQYPLLSIDNWTYYLKTLTANLNPSFLIWVGLAATAGCLRVASRAKTSRVLLALALFLAAFSMIRLKETRYVVGVVPLAGALLAVGSAALLELPAVPRLIRLAALSLAAFLTAHSLFTTTVPSVQGIKEAAGDILRRYPGERVLYDGLYNGVFVFYARSDPAGARASITRGSKVFFATAFNKHFGLVEFVQAPGDVEMLVRRAGCRWLIFEREELLDVPAARLAREVVSTDPSFRLIRSFPISTQDTPRLTYLDLYEYLGDLDPEPEDRLVFPVLGDFGANVDHREHPDRSNVNGPIGDSQPSEPTLGDRSRRVKQYQEYKESNH